MSAAESLASLQRALLAAGFCVSPNPLASRDGECKWHAYKRSAIPARECGCNDGKPAQIVVTPHHFTYGSHSHESASVDLTGECGGIWFKLEAYSLRWDELLRELPVVERALVAAWNALAPASDATPINPQASTVDGEAGSSSNEQHAQE